MNTFRKKNLNEISIYTDACYRKLKEEPIYVAFVVYDNSTDKIKGIFTDVVYKPAYSSTYAEYWALWLALTYLTKVKHGKITICSDNENMVKQIQGKRRTKVSNLQEMKHECDQLWEATRLGNILKIIHVPGKYNLADKPVRELKKNELRNKDKK